MIWFALALLVLGAVIGGRGLKGLGRLVRGPWRPGVGVLGVIAAFFALALAARGQWIAAALVLAVGAGAIGIARSRPAPRQAPPAPEVLGRREAESILGVAPNASALEVEAAYKRLIRMAHPDTGGTPGLAAKLNAARATLLGR